MGRVKRFAAVLVVIEVALAGGWFWLARYGAANPDRVTPDFQVVVGETMGTAMGVVAAVGAVLLFVKYRQARGRG